MAAELIPFPRRGANDNSIDPNPPQPGLRSFIVYDELPEGCIAIEIEDETQAPHFHRGDFAIIDTRDTEPAHAEMFGFQWGQGNPSVILAQLRPGRYGCGPKGEMVDTVLWWAKWTASFMSLVGVPSVPRPWGDGPYSEGHFREKLLGRVVGILEADFRANLRRAA